MLYRNALDKALQQEIRLAEAKNTPQVYWAIENEPHGTLERLVEKGVDVNMRDEDSSGRPLDVGLCFCVHNFEKTKAFMKPYFEARFSPLA